MNNSKSKRIELMLTEISRLETENATLRNQLYQNLEHSGRAIAILSEKNIKFFNFLKETNSIMRNISNSININKCSTDLAKCKRDIDIFLTKMDFL